MDNYMNLSILPLYHCKIKSHISHISCLKVIFTRTRVHQSQFSQAAKVTGDIGQWLPPLVCGQDNIQNLRQSCGMSNGAVACEGHRMCQAFTSSASGIFWDFKATLCNFSKTPCFRRQCFGYYGANMIHLSNCQPSVRCFPGCVQRFTTLQPQKCGRADLPLEV